MPYRFFHPFTRFFYKMLKSWKFCEFTNFEIFNWIELSFEKLYIADFYINLKIKLEKFYQGILLTVKLKKKKKESPSNEYINCKYCKLSTSLWKLKRIIIIKKRRSKRLWMRSYHRMDASNFAEVWYKFPRVVILRLSLIMWFLLRRSRVLNLRVSSKLRGCSYINRIRLIYNVVKHRSPANQPAA